MAVQASQLMVKVGADTQEATEQLTSFSVNVGRNFASMSDAVTAASARIDAAMVNMGAVSEEWGTRIRASQSTLKDGTLVWSATASGIKDVENAERDASISIAQANSALSGNVGALEAIGGPAGIATAAVIGLGVAAVKAGADFEYNMTIIRNNTMMTNADFKAMESTVMQQSAATGASLNDLADGFRHASNLGYSYADSQKIVAAANELATATGASVGETTNRIAGIMKEFGIDANDAGRAENTMFAIAAQGNMTFQELADYSGRLNAVTGALKGSLIDEGSAMDALTRHGFDAAQAQTQLLGIITHIIAPTASATAELKQLSKTSGVDLVSDFSLAGLQAKGLSGIFDDLRVATNGDSSEILRLIPALRGGQGAMVLLTTGAQDWNNTAQTLSETMSGQLTPATDALTREEDTLGGTTNILKARVHELGVTVGSELTPALQADVANLINTGNAFDEFGAHVHNATMQVLAFLGASSQTPAATGGSVADFSVLESQAQAPPPVYGPPTPYGPLVKPVVLGPAVPSNLPGLADQERAAEIQSKIESIFKQAPGSDYAQVYAQAVQEVDKALSHVGGTADATTAALNPLTTAAQDNSRALADAKTQAQLYADSLTSVSGLANDKAQLALAEKKNELADQYNAILEKQKSVQLEIKTHGADPVGEAALARLQAAYDEALAPATEAAAKAQDDYNLSALKARVADDEAKVGIDQLTASTMASKDALQAGKDALKAHTDALSGVSDALSTTTTRANDLNKITTTLTATQDLSTTHLNNSTNPSIQTMIEKLGLTHDALQKVEDEINNHHVPALLALQDVLGKDSTYVSAFTDELNAIPKDIQVNVGLNYEVSGSVQTAKALGTEIGAPWSPNHNTASGANIGGYQLSSDDQSAITNVFGGNASAWAAAHNQEVKAGAPGSLVPGYASGTGSAAGGLSLVGEDGPELLNLPHGSQVFPLSRYSGGSSIDYGQLAAAIASEFRRNPMVLRIPGLEDVVVKMQTTAQQRGRL